MLTKIEVDSIKDPGAYGDGGGLQLLVRASKDGIRKSWVFRYTLAGRTRHMGLGSYLDVSLADARKKAQAQRKHLDAGIDPIEHRDAELAKTRVARRTFADAAESHYAKEEVTWSEGNKRVWRNILVNHILPVIGNMRVADITKDDVLRVLNRNDFWITKTPTAKRCQGAMKDIFNHAIARDWRSSANPAAWEVLQHLISSPEEVHKTKHHPSLPWPQLAELMEHLREIGDRTIHGNDLQAVAAWAIELQIVTVGRPIMAANAKWSEIDVKNRLWSVAAEGMKNRKKFRIPLSDTALALLAKAEKRRVNDWVFPGRGLERLSKVGPWQLLQKMGYVDEHGDPIHLHGFRGSFSTWGREATSYSRDVIEMSMDHNIKTTVEAAYYRGDMLEQRRAVLDDWAKVCNGEWLPATVIPLRQKTGND
jgi:integrase